MINNNKMIKNISIYDCTYFNNNSTTNADKIKIDFPRLFECTFRDRGKRSLTHINAKNALPFLFFLRATFTSRHTNHACVRTRIVTHAFRALHLGIYPPFPQERDLYLKARTRWSSCLISAMRSLFRELVRVALGFRNGICVYRIFVLVMSRYIGFC